MEEITRIKPKTNVYNYPDGILIQLFMPGLEKRTLQVELDQNDKLVVRGHITPPMDLIPQKAEFSEGIYHRMFTVNGHYDTNRINAKYNNGVLSIKIPVQKEMIKSIPIN